MEGGAAGVRIGQHVAPALPGLREVRRVSQAMASRPDGVRRIERHPVGLAEHRWGDDQGPPGGEKTGPNPTDRAKSGTKRSLLTDGAGVPLALAVSGANTHDKRLVEPTLESMAVERPEPASRKKQPFCADKGYDYPDVRALVNERDYTAHLESRGDEEKERRSVPGYRARRWVVERTHSWFNRFRRLLIRWEKKSANDVAQLHFACAWVTFRAAGVLG